MTCSGLYQLYGFSPSKWLRFTFQEWSKVMEHKSQSEHFQCSRLDGVALVTLEYGTHRVDGLPVQQLMGGDCQQKTSGCGVGTRQPDGWTFDWANVSILN